MKIIDGVFYEDDNNIPPINTGTRFASKQFFDGKIEQDRTDYAQDTIQPYINGKPNEDFIERYNKSEQSKYMVKEENEKEKF